MTSSVMVDCLLELCWSDEFLLPLAPPLDISVFLCVTSSLRSQFVPQLDLCSPAQQVMMCSIPTARVVRIMTGTPAKKDQGLQRPSWSSGSIRRIRDVPQLVIASHIVVAGAVAVRLLGSVDMAKVP